MTLDELRRTAWDNALLFTLYQRTEAIDDTIDGEQLLAAILDEAADAMARLKERGLIDSDEEPEEPEEEA